MASTCTNQITLTIGLEFEMVVHHQLSPEMGCINLFIAKKLREGLAVGFTNPVHSPYKAPTSHVGAAKTMLIVSDSPCLTPVADWVGDNPNPRHFFVTSKPDCLHDIPDNQDGFSNGIEVRTPILRLGSWQFATESVLNTLSKIPGINIQLTENCGLHVHIGRRGGFDLSHIKGLAKAVVIFEEEIEKACHPAHRYGAGKKLYADSNRNSSFLLMGLKTTLEMVRLIDRQPTISAVRRTICDIDVGYRDFKYNFQSLVEFGTIEFRQAQGTLDAKWAVEWVRMLISFVRAAGLVGATLFEMFAVVTDNGENRLSEFLEWGEHDANGAKSGYKMDEKSQ